MQNIEASYGLVGYQVSLLTSLPVLCFGLGAFAGPWVIQRFGLTRSFTIIFTLMTAAIALRPWFGFGFMLALSLLIGVAIALSNVLFPTLIRTEFPNSVPKMTAFYTLILPVFASLGAAISVPMLQGFADWRPALAVWAVPGVIAVLVWQIANRQVSSVSSGPALELHSSSQVWRSPVTWGIVGFFGLQSVGFYAVINWLPGILMAQGYSQAEAGSLVGFTTIIGVPFGFAVTSNLKRFKSQNLLIVAISLLTTIGFAILLAGHNFAVLAGVFIGIGMSCSFPVALALIGLKAHTPQTTTLLSAIAQGFGYLIAALGTFMVGQVHDWTGGWIAAICLLVAISLAQILAGVLANSRESL